MKGKLICGKISKDKYKNDLDTAVIHECKGQKLMNMLFREFAVEIKKEHGDEESSTLLKAMKDIDQNQLSFGV